MAIVLLQVQCSAALQKCHLQVLNRALAGDNGLHEEACMHRPHVMMCEGPFC